MVSNKVILIMIIISLLLLGVSLLINIGYSDISVEKGSGQQGNFKGETQGNINLIINPPANVGEEKNEG